MNWSGAGKIGSSPDCPCSARLFKPTRLARSRAKLAALAFRHHEVEALVRETPAREAKTLFEVLSAMFHVALNLDFAPSRES